MSRERITMHGIRSIKLMNELVVRERKGAKLQEKDEKRIVEGRRGENKDEIMT